MLFGSWGYLGYAGGWFAVVHFNVIWHEERYLSARPATDGRFTFTDLLAGEYFLAALTDLDPLDWQAPTFLDHVAPAAVKVRVAEGGRTVQDLRIR
jgi:hypothetical protein